MVFAKLLTVFASLLSERRLFPAYTDLRSRELIVQRLGDTVRESDLKPHV
jgi:hypothetical protein